MPLCDGLVKDIDILIYVSLRNLHPFDLNDEILINLLRFRFLSIQFWNTNRGFNNTRSLLRRSMNFI